LCYYGHLKVKIIKGAYIKNCIVLSQKEKESFLNLARKSIEFFLKTKNVPTFTELNIDLPSIKNERLGVFVTLTKNDDLRGCIGYVQGFKPLFEGIIDNAINAAVKDPRFPQVTINEFSDLHIEISILSPLEEVKDINKIKVGTHGLIISKGLQSGLLLPQVAVEWNWDLKTFLENTCNKAGLPKDAWKSGAKIQCFTATIFNEK